MHRNRSKRSQAIRTAVVYSVMTTLVVVGLVIAVLYVMGYRFDSKNRTIDQGGLVQIESRPSGAQIVFDGERVSGTSPRQINTTAGAHTVRLARDGYRPWQKTITVEPGGVHWLSYMLLIPEQLKSTAVRHFENVASAVPIPGSDRMLIMESKRSPRFRIIQLDKAEVVADFELPSSLQPTGSGQYILHDWSRNNRSIILEYRQGKTSRWYILNTRQVADSIDINAIIGGDEAVRNVQFVSDSDRLVYAQVGDTIRRVDAANRTVTAPLVDKVSAYWQGLTGVLTYVTTHDSKTKTRELGYLTADADRPRVIQTVYSGASTVLRAVIGSYHNRSYLALQNANTISVNRFSLHPSDSERSLEMSNVAVINTENVVRDLAFSPNNRFIVAQHDATYMTYDIELDRFTTTTLRGTEKVNQPIAWLDAYHIWSSRDGELRSYEFDGENVQSLGAVVEGLTPQLSRNSEALYVFRSADDGVELRRIDLRVK